MLELQPTSLSDAIADTVETLQWAATAKGITLSSEVDRRLPLVCADPTRMRQILIILVENAIKFTPAIGAVKIQARLLERDPGLLLIEVSDSGLGISPDVLERIFERLFQAPIPAFAARRGLGLGLYICKDLVNRQGGEIWATSNPGSRRRLFRYRAYFFSIRLDRLGLQKGKLHRRSCRARSNRDRFTDRLAFRTAASGTVS